MSTAIPRPLSAIRLVTDAASTYALLVDDVEFEGADWEISGYDIYRNDRIVATADASATSWEGDIDSDLDLYRVGVRYKGNAFSRLSNEVSAASGLENIARTLTGTILSITSRESVSASEPKISADSRPESIFTVTARF